MFVEISPDTESLQLRKSSKLFLGNFALRGEVELHNSKCWGGLYASSFSLQNVYVHYRYKLLCIYYMHVTHVHIFLEWMYYHSEYHWCNVCHTVQESA